MRRVSLCAKNDPGSESHDLTFSRHPYAEFVYKNEFDSPGHGLTTNDVTWLPTGTSWHKSRQLGQGTVGQNNQKYRLKYWASRSSVRSHRSLVRLLGIARFALTLHCAHSLTRSLTPLLVGQWMIGWLFCLCFFLFLTIVRLFFPDGLRLWNASLTMCNEEY